MPMPQQLPQVAVLFVRNPDPPRAQYWRGEPEGIALSPNNVFSIWIAAGCHRWDHLLRAQKDACFFVAVVNTWPKIITGLMSVNGDFSPIDYPR